MALFLRFEIRIAVLCNDKYNLCSHYVILEGHEVRCGADLGSAGYISSQTNPQPVLRQSKLPIPSFHWSGPTQGNTKLW